MEKKTESLTVKLTPTTKAAIEKEAKEHDWTLSKTAEKILTAWANEQKEEE